MATLSYRNNYQEKEDEKYKAWKNDIKEINYLVYIISGDHFWKKETVDSMSEVLERRPDQVNENLKIYTDKMRYKSISRKKHFVLFESKGSTLKENDLNTLKEYLAEPSENGVLIIYLKDRSEKRYFLRNFKMIHKSKYINLMDMDYVSDRFKENFVRDKIREYGFVFENDKLYVDVVKNLILNLDDLEDNLMTLSSLETSVITREEVKSSIEEYSDNSLNKLYDSLSKLNRKRVPFELVQELLSDGLKPINLINGIRRYFTYMYQAKYLKLRGIMRHNDVEEAKKEIYLDEGIIFNNPDIWELSKYRRNQFLRDCDEISLREIIYILNVLENSVYKERIRDGDKYIYREYTDEVLLMHALITIMNRHQQV